ncbi:YfiT family bacillithiol transferase [Shivajiella indica]|uniref:YfiT family bacillithiol transferase n=1 Tax=Shivajiella indica TaxID=872115 RepID=A0ABW5BAA3_9BACT
MSTALQYPIGKFKASEKIDTIHLRHFIQDIEDFPKLLKQEVEQLTEIELDTPYRPGGWTIRQVVHHCADSHMNSFIRFKLALTEENPHIKPYLEHLWAESVDYLEMPVSFSLSILEGLHARWVFLLKSLTEKDLKRTFYHPEKQEEIPLDKTIALYSWHCRHHLAHVQSIRKKVTY